MNNPIILDTHVLLWLLPQPEELTKETRQHITLAQENGQLLICSISLWEIAMLQFKRRVNIYEPIKDFLNYITDISGLSIKEISPEIVAESILLMDNFHEDSADRIIAAAATVYGATLITRDQQILDWAKLGHAYLHSARDKT